MTPNDRHLLAQTLTLIAEIDPSAHGTEDAPDAADRYAQRNRLIYQAIAIAARGGLEAGFAIDPREPDWPVAFIELGPGKDKQVSWHMPAHRWGYDGHSTAEKYQRIEAYGRAVGR